MAGAPVKKYPEGSWKYVHHEIMLVDEEKTIFVTHFSLKCNCLETHS